jgi:hypothetical protein
MTSLMGEAKARPRTKMVGVRLKILLVGADVWRGRKAKSLGRIYL